MDQFYQKILITNSHQPDKESTIRTLKEIFIYKKEYLTSVLSV